jgi:hypothetical protein
MDLNKLLEVPTVDFLKLWTDEEFLNLKDLCLQIEKNCNLMADQRKADKYREELDNMIKVFHDQVMDITK